MNGIVPAPIAALPWRVIFVLFGLATFGTLVLYSAAGAASAHGQAIISCVFAC